MKENTIQFIGINGNVIGERPLDILQKALNKSPQDLFLKGVGCSLDGEAYEVIDSTYYKDASALIVYLEEK